ncbi:MAG: formate dehydrogenase accessory sulfurtransferase FdhD [Actinomycetota bacterium]
MAIKALDAPSPRPGSKTPALVRVIEDGRVRARSDQLATEEPLEIRLSAGGTTRSLAVTMRTPGADFELAAGFLHNEGVLHGHDELAEIRYCLDSSVDETQRYNIVTVETRDTQLPDLAGLERHFSITSACGVCGKASLEALHLRGHAPLPSGPVVEPAVLHALPQKLRRAQRVFDATGGLHAAALFSSVGDLVALREDVGRHNALDKLIGWAFLERRLPLEGHIVVMSGRSSFEIVQKCLAAGVPVVAAVSAPSSLAVEVARAFGITLIGFLRGSRFNIYSGHERVRTI